MTTHQAVAYRGMVFYFKDSANLANLPQNSSEHSPHFIYHEDGVIIVEAGKIKAVGSYHDIKAKLTTIKVVDYQNNLITPGFIDTHLHATQSGIVASYGEKLLEWLEQYVFPGEIVFANPNRARKELNFFIDQLLMNGTTTAVAYGPSFLEATDIFFEELDRRNMRFITGNMLMDRNGADALCFTTQQCHDMAEKMINKWHNKNRLSFALSPRFAISCSEELLQACATLHKKYPDVYLQTHLDENLAEVEEVKKLYPKSKNYLGVYHQFGLVGKKSVFGHCVHTTDAELELFKATQATMAWCPVSNNFLGSGIFNFEKASKYTSQITLATDWGGGNTLSMLQVMGDAYKASMLKNYKLPCMVNWYLATLGSARALQLDDKIGNFEVGKEADFIVIDPNASSYMNYRSKKANDIFDLLFMLITLGSEQNIKATYIFGEMLCTRQNCDIFICSAD